MKVALKVMLGYMLVMLAIAIPCIGMTGALFIQDPLYLIPTVLGTFLLIFVVHSPVLKYIETQQRKILDV
jgi:hypothetical protein